MKLPGSLWAVTSFFNPAGYRNKYENYRLFRESSRRQGLNLIAVELAYHDQPFELKDGDAEILIHLRGNDLNVMWQKERLLNIGFGRLPGGCDKVVWLDSDIIFCNDDWIAETSELLEKYVAVQAFSHVVMLPQGITMLTEDERRALESGVGLRQRHHGAAFSAVHESHNAVMDITRGGRPGGAWAMRRSVIEKTLLFDESVVGCGDNFFLAALYGKHTAHFHRAQLTDSFLKRYDQWAEGLFSEVKGSVYYTNGDCLHLWHGDRINRLLDYRFLILQHIHFDPQRHLARDPNGVWTWVSAEHAALLKEYFEFRNEEQPRLTLSHVLCEELNRLRDLLSKRPKKISEYLGDFLKRLIRPKH